MFLILEPLFPYVLAQAVPQSCETERYDKKIEIYHGIYHSRSASASIKIQKLSNLILKPWSFSENVHIEKIRNFWNGITEKMFLFFQPPVFLIFVKIWTPVFVFENYKKLDIKCTIVFQVFIKFWSSERNTENTMSQLYFNEEIDYSEENTCENDVFRSTIFHHRKKLNIFTPQLLIYYM